VAQAGIRPRPARPQTREATTRHPIRARASSPSYHVSSQYPSHALRSPPTALDSPLSILQSSSSSLHSPTPHRMPHIHAQGQPARTPSALYPTPTSGMMSLCQSHATSFRWSRRWCCWGSACWSPQSSSERCQAAMPTTCRSHCRTYATTPTRTPFPAPFLLPYLHTPTPPHLHIPPLPPPRPHLLPPPRPRPSHLLLPPPPQRRHPPRRQ